MLSLGNYLKTKRTMTILNQLSKDSNYSLLQPSEDEIKLVILYLAKITEEDELRLFPHKKGDSDLMIDFYLWAKSSLIYLIKVEVYSNDITKDALTFFHYSQMWDLSDKTNENDYFAFDNQVLILENGKLTKYE
jgi:hypothetical protein